MKTFKRLNEAITDVNKNKTSSLIEKKTTSSLIMNILMSLLKIEV